LIVIILNFLLLTYTDPDLFILVVGFFSALLTFDLAFIDILLTIF